jgi:urease accessory protein
MSSMGGGLVDKDRIEISLRVSSGATSFVGTQASTKVFRSPSGTGCRQELGATVENDATLAVLPDPVTCFAGARYEQTQRFDVHEMGNLLLLDWLTSGRWSSGERWAFSRYSSRTDVFVGGEHRVADALVLDPRDGDLTGAFRMGDFNCLATVVAVGQRFNALVESALRDVGSQRIGSQGVGGEMSVVESVSPIKGGALLRVVGASAEIVGRFLRQRLEPVTQILGESPWERKW